MRKIENAIHQAVAAGVTLFDTADVYGLGLSERRLKRILGSSRHDLWISTKGGVCWKKDKTMKRARTWKDGSSRYLEKAVEASLRRLGLDVLPIYFLHWPDPETPLSRTFATLENLRQQGKILHIGFSNGTASQIKTALRYAKITFVQTRINFLEKIDGEIVKTCSESGIKVLAYNVLGAGLLTGKFTKDTRFPSTDRRSRLRSFTGKKIRNTDKKLKLHRQRADQMGVSLAQYAIRWALKQSFVTSVILGIKNCRQLRENLLLDTKTNVI